MAAGGIEAERVITASPQEAFDYLARLDHHWQLTDRRVAVVSLDHAPGAPDGSSFDRGTVRMRGPLGIGRTAYTVVDAAEPPSSLRGHAVLGGGTLARVSWTLADAGHSTWVRLAAEIESASALDRILLALGGRVWMRRMFASVLDRLDAVLEEGKEASAARAADGSSGGRI
jgi:hypothetical protein